MKIIYPIFLKDRDHWMFVLKNQKEVEENLEKIDIEDKEYIGWDAEGKLLDFFVKEDEIKVGILSEKSHSEEVKKAILGYAHSALPKVPFLPSKAEVDLLELFNKVEKHIRENTGFLRIITFFKKRKI